MARFARPPALRERDHVHCIAPSSPFDRTRFDAGALLIAERYEVVHGRSLFAQRGYLAGEDAARLDDLAAALRDGSVRALVAARGGYGATRLLPQLSVDEIRSRAKWLVGFSDVTALHALWAQAGLCSIHGPMVCSLSEASARLREAWFDLLAGAVPSALDGLQCVASGRAEGRLFGGNLTVLAALVGTPYLPSLRDVVLLLEDVGERPYRLDRALTSMLQAGALDGVRAIVLGQFTQCEPGVDGVTAADVLRERLARLAVPIVADAPVGHVAENRPLLLGSHAAVDADAGTVHFE
jgi:muramoyltetrapeptide carboxypeptidase